MREREAHGVNCELIESIVDDWMQTPPASPRFVVA